MTPFFAAAPLPAAQLASWLYLEGLVQSQAPAQTTLDLQPGAGGATMALLAEVARSMPAAVRLAAPGALLILTVALAIQFARRLPHDPIRFESHWGGFGGGVEGWRMSGSLGFLVGAIAFGAMFTMVARDLARAAPPSGAIAVAADSAAAPRGGAPGTPSGESLPPDSASPMPSPDLSGSRR